ncbi:MAG: hypothetical protein COT74_01065 [Bdellovibrionales bacterium CG10_big_fil_rev_8_21_14_0_10_45_34]|nr:MAG: hypothetical protein COT74_01065 [Bdellovibrionales bacterium CG10_big_fil_rev_8_21_14_0_10_45_34]
MNQLPIEVQEPWVKIRKPSSWLTHSDSKSIGILEYWSHHLGKKIWPCHRLDRETTGALLASLTPEGADKFRKLNETGEVEKIYLALTDRPLEDYFGASSEFVTTRECTDTTEIPQSDIEVLPAQFAQKEFVVDKPVVGKDGKPLTARSTFRLLRTYGDFSCWQVRIESGRTHQIRKHAAFLGIPLLGDIMYGGSPFPILGLHSWQISLADTKHTVAPPVFYDKMEILKSPQLAFFLASVFDRRSSLDFCAAVRVVHSSTLIAEKLADVLVLGDYGREENPNDTNITFKNLRPHIPELLISTETKHWVYRDMRKRDGRIHQLPEERSLNVPENWQIQEEGMLFEVSRMRGLSYGLFLDQRANRRWVRSSCRNLRVLNLFSYTGGFSVAAAFGQAAHITSLDVSRSYLRWSQQNLKLNGFEVDSRFSFISEDALEYLKRCSRREHKFDLIVCDPPSFGRSSAGVFNIEKDLPQLAQSVFECLAPGGSAILSCNFEKWTQENFERKAFHNVDQAGHSSNYEVTNSPLPDADFEAPGADRVLKTLVYKKIV